MQRADTWESQGTRQALSDVVRKRERNATRKGCAWIPGDAARRRHAVRSSSGESRLLHNRAHRTEPGERRRLYTQNVAGLQCENCWLKKIRGFKGENKACPQAQYGNDRDPRPPERWKSNCRNCSSGTFWGETREGPRSRARHVKTSLSESCEMAGRCGKGHQGSRKVDLGI